MSIPGVMPVLEKENLDQIGGQFVLGSGGDWAIAWVSPYRPPKTFDDPIEYVYVKFYQADGSSEKEVRLAQTENTYGVELCDTVALQDGSYLLVWRKYLADNTNDYDTYATIVGQDGKEVGESLLIQSTSDSEVVYIKSLQAGSGWYDLTAQSHVSSQPDTISLVKHDASGDVVTTASYDNTGGDVTGPVDAANLSNGKIALAISSAKYDGAGGYEDYKLTLRILNADLSVYKDNIAAPLYLEDPSIIDTHDGGFLIAGRRSSSLFFERFDAEGNLLFSKRESNDVISYSYHTSWSVTALNDGSYIAMIVQGSQTEMYRYAADGSFIGQKTSISGQEVQIEAYGENGYLIMATDHGGISDLHNLYLREVNGDGTSLFSYDGMPASKNVRISIAEDHAVHFLADNFPFFDYEPPELGAIKDNFAGIILTGLPSAGKLTLSGHAVKAGDQVKVDDIPHLLFTPGKDDFGASYANFKFKVMDDGKFNAGGSNTSLDAYSFVINVTDVADRVTGTAVGEKMPGTKGMDILYGLGGNDTLQGRAGKDKLFGGAGNDVLAGGDGDDILQGGRGVDKLHGGAGADTFIFRTGDSGKTRTTADTLYDFSSKDLIDLTDWDADAKAPGVQGFAFIDTHAFTGHAGELRFTKATSDIWIEGDTNGDKRTDFTLHIDMGITLTLALLEL